MLLRRSAPIPSLRLLRRVALLASFVFPAAAAHTQRAGGRPNAVAELPAGLVSRSLPNRFLVLYRDGVIPPDAAVAAERAGGRMVGGHTHLGVGVVQARSAAGAAALRVRLAADRRVEAVVADRLVEAGSVQVRAAQPAGQPGADALYRSPQGWAVRMVGGLGDPATPGPWRTTRGAGVRIAILDSGVDRTHPDLAPNLVLNVSEIDQSAVSGMPSTCDDGSPQDQTGHGSWTASLAAGALGPGTGLIAGVAPQAALLNIKVLERMPGVPSVADPTGCRAGQAGGLLSWVLRGIDDAVAAHANIISMSLGTLIDLSSGDGAGLKTLFDRATNAAAEAGVLLIAAAGNDGLVFPETGPAAAGGVGRLLELPAQARGVLAIEAATNPACAENLAQGSVCVGGAVTLPYYSNRGAGLEALSAPGGSYPGVAGVADTTDPSGWVTGACSAGSPSEPGCFGLGHTAYVQAIGTSAAAPLAAGAAALAWAAHPEWTVAQLVAALRASAIAYPGLPVGLVSAFGPVTQTTQPTQPPSAPLAPAPAGPITGSVGDS